MSVEAIAWALRQQTGDPRAKIILLCLANYADEKGQCWPSQATLADQTEQSIDTVQDRIGDIEESGLIRREKRFRPDGGKTSDLFVLQMGPAGTHTATGGEGIPLLAGTHTAPAPVWDTATGRYHRSVTDTKDEEERGNLAIGKREGQKESARQVVWIDGEDPSFNALADRREAETGDRPYPTGSKNATGQGFYFPADWLPEATAH